MAIQEKHEFVVSVNGTDVHCSTREEAEFEEQVLLLGKRIGELGRWYDSEVGPNDVARFLLTEFYLVPAATVQTDLPALQRKLILDQVLKEI